MDIIIKSAAVALIAAGAGLLIKKSNPEISVVLSAALTVGIMLAAVSLAGCVKDLRDTVKNIAGISETYLSPVMKCTGIAVVTRISAALCRDSSQQAASSAIDFSGAVCALAAAMPLVISTLTTIGELA